MGKASSVACSLPRGDDAIAWPALPVPEPCTDREAFLPDLRARPRFRFLADGSPDRKARDVGWLGESFFCRSRAGDPVADQPRPLQNTSSGNTVSHSSCLM